MGEYSRSPARVLSVEGLSWMCGSWIERREDRRCEEIWSSPDGETLMGMFRWVSDDEVSFFEFMVIKPIENGVELHAKHFHSNLVGWEDRSRYQAFSLTELAKNRAVFSAQPLPETPDTLQGWLVYERREDSMIVQLVEATGDVKLTFRFTNEAAP